MAWISDLIITSGDMSDDIISEVIDMKDIFNYSLQYVGTGATAAGVISIEVSNNKVNWEAVTGASVTVSGAGNMFVEYSQNTSARYLRVKYTRTSGTGTLNAWICGKGV